MADRDDRAEVGCTVGLCPRQQRGPVVVLGGPSEDALQELYLEFLEVVRKAGLDAEASMT